MMETQVKLLRIYTDETAYFGDIKVFEEVASRARNDRMAGATILQALFGFGRTAHEHRRRVFEDDQSLVIEIIDEDLRLRTFAASLKDLPGIALMTLEAVEVLGGEGTTVEPERK